MNNLKFLPRHIKLTEPYLSMYEDCYLDFKIEGYPFDNLEQIVFKSKSVTRDEKLKMYTLGLYNVESEGKSFLAPKEFKNYRDYLVSLVKKYKLIQNFYYEKEA